MNPRKSMAIVQRILLVLALIALPSVAMAQKHGGGSAPKAPAAKPAAPAAKPAAPAGGAKPGGAQTGARTGTTGTTGARTGATGTTGARTGTTGATGAKTGTTGATGAKTGTTGATGAKTGGATNTSARTGGATGAAGGKTGAAGGAKSPGVTNNARGGGKTVTTKSGSTAHTDAHGRVTSIHTANGATINRAPNGSRRVETHLSGGGRLVSNGHRGGYAEHPYNRGGHAYMRRTYYRNGHAYAYGYRGRYYHGGYYYGYVNPYYYNPGFYGWAYNPWAAPVAWSWGWGAAPWYGYYGYYFNPYPVYASAALWMTDYIVAASLQESYEAQVANANAAAANANAAAANANAAAANAAAAGPAQASVDNSAAPAVGSSPALTPEVKEAIAEEVKAQLAAEKDAAAANASAPAAAAPAATAQPASTATPPEETPEALDPNHRTFIVNTVLTETAADGSECALSSGDVVTRIEDTPDANASVKVLVSSSQKSDCHSGTQVAVKVDDLQDMHNHFREQLDSGLKELASKQGTAGMPAAPAGSTATKNNPDGQVQPDLTVQQQLQSQEADADKSEAEVQEQAAQPAGQGND
jgi:hypothetical protein